MLNILFSTVLVCAIVAFVIYFCFFMTVNMLTGNRNYKKYLEKLGISQLEKEDGKEEYYDRKIIFYNQGN